MIPRQIPDLFPSILRPTIANCGFAVFSAANATIGMGGVFPFLPGQYQDSSFMFAYYLAQSLTLALMYLVGATLALRFSSVVRLVQGASVVSYFAGCCLAIGSMYAHDNPLPFYIGCGTLIGVGTAGIHLAWQRIFAAQPSDEGTRNLIVGTAYSAVIYFALYLVPVAVAQLLVPTVFLPLTILCVVLEQRSNNFDQPMFKDDPATVLNVYRQAAHDYWRSAVCVGSIGLASGVVRSMATTNALIGAEVNAAALAGSLIAAGCLLALWRRKSLKIRVTAVFRIVFPLLIVGFVALRAFGEPYARILSSVLYMTYSFSTMLMLIQCAQASRDRGVNPIIMFGGFAGIVYLMHDIGFVSGYSTETLRAAGVDPYSAIALITVSLLALVYYAAQGGLSKALSGLQATADRIELVALEPDLRNDAARQNASPTPSNQADRSESLNSTQTIARASSDEILACCLRVQGRYRLTDRETEVMQYLALGKSMRSIAVDLVVSESTIRTHAKRIYAKLGIHKRVELQNLIALFANET